MGKNLITQKRGRGTMTYTANTHRSSAVGDLQYRHYDDLEKKGVLKAVVKEIHHSSIHSAPILELLYENGDKSFLSATEKIRVNDVIQAGAKAPIEIGNIVPLKNVPEGTLISNIESTPGDGGSFCKSAGTVARVVVSTATSITVELPSKKKREFNPECRATIGIIAGSGKQDKPWLKAGKKHHYMRAKGHLYPHTSGVAMNAVNHPFGSGRGRHAGKSMTPPRFAPPGRNVGRLHARSTGRGGKKG